MTTNNDTQLQQNKLTYSILEHLQELKLSATADVSESLDVAIQCISDSLGVTLNNEEHASKYSVKPLNLNGIFGLGLARKEQIEAAINASRPTQQQVKQEPLDPELEKKFAEYKRLLTEKNYFVGTEEGTPEYQVKVDKARAKFLEKYQPTTPAPSTPAATTTTTSTSTTTSSSAPTSPSLTSTSGPSPVTPKPASPTSDNIKTAEDFKNLGNQKLSSHQYQEAIEYYTKAIEHDSTNAIYYANRAAAYSQVNKHQEAIDDCNQAIQRNPNYGKAYSRLGLAYFSLGKYTEATTHYKRALELDPNNATIKHSLEVAENKSREATSPAASRNFSGGLADIVNNPTFQNLAQNLSGAGGADALRAAAGAAGAGGAGGAPDFNTLLNNPALLNMAQNMMSQPGFSDMLNNPAMMNMAQSFMQNPEALSGILQGVFGNQGNTGGDPPAQ